MADQQTPDFMQLIETFKKAPPEEKAQLRSFLILIGFSPEKIAEFEATIDPPDPFTAKQRALESLNRKFKSAATENADNQELVEDLRRAYEEEKKKIFES